MFKSWLSTALSGLAKGIIVTTAFFGGVSAALSTTSPGAPTEVYSSSGRCSSPLTTTFACSLLGRELVLRNPNEYYFILDEDGNIVSAIPSNAIPSNAIPSNAIPANAIPSNAIPSNLRIMEAIPSNAIPSNLAGKELAGIRIPINPIIAGAKMIRVQGEYQPLGERVCGSSAWNCASTVSQYSAYGSVYMPGVGSPTGGACGEQIGYVEAYAYDVSGGNMAVNIVHEGGYEQSEYRIRMGSRNYDCEIWPEDRERLVCIVPRQTGSPTLNLYPGSADCTLLTQVTVEVSSSAPPKPSSSGGGGGSGGSGGNACGGAPASNDIPAYNAWCSCMGGSFSYGPSGCEPPGCVGSCSLP